MIVCAYLIKNILQFQASVAILKTYLNLFHGVIIPPPLAAVKLAYWSMLKGNRASH